MTVPMPTALHIVLLIVALIGFLLPWVVAPSGPMTLNAFDLAEWVSLHPSQHHTFPPLQASLWLRLQLLIICWSFSAVTVKTPRRLAAALCIVMLALAQLPPPEFVLDPGNLNYRQQLVLALASLIGGLALLRVKRARTLIAMLVALPCAGAATALAGIIMALEVYASLQSGGALGTGLWILVACYTGIILVNVVSNFKQWSRS